MPRDSLSVRSHTTDVGLTTFKLFCAETVRKRRPGSTHDRNPWTIPAPEDKIGAIVSGGSTSAYEGTPVPSALLSVRLAKRDHYGESAGTRT